jgi:hypothetical protein
MVTLNSITKDWFEKLTAIRKLYPKNRLLKHLISSAWGHLNAGNTINKTWEEIEKEKLDVAYDGNADYKIIDEVYLSIDVNDSYYVLLDTKSPYKCNIRLKPYITAIARNMTAEIALQNIKKVVRIQTDCISFTEKMSFDNPNLILEEKTTGTVFFHSVNCYHNTTTGYKTKDFDRIVLKNT